MNGEFLKRAAAAVMVVASVAMTAYAGCCKYNVSWDNPGQECAGTVVIVCESSSSDCNQERAGCSLANGTRNAICYKIDLGRFGVWGRFSCVDPPPEPWQFVAVNPDGSCCYVKGATISQSSVLNYMVNNCEGPCTGGGGGGT